MNPVTHPAPVGLLSAIIAEPDSDDLRLIYADWLEENGEPEHAEFVRVQVQLAKASPCSGLRRSGHPRPCRICRPFEALRRRERELEASAFTGEEAVFGDCNAFAQRAWHFRRGFVSEVASRIEDWCGAECKQCEGAKQLYGPHGQFSSGFYPCYHCRGTGRISGHGPALVRAAPLERVTLTEWRGGSCRACYLGCVPTDRVDNTCEVCRGLYNSAAALAWARAQPG